MMTPSQTRQLAATYSVGALLVVVGMVTLVGHHNTNNDSPKRTTANVQKSKTSSPTSNTDKQPGTNTTPEDKSSDADKQTVAAGNAQPATIACSLLTLQIAQQILGTNTVAATPSGTADLQTNDTTTNSCAYTNGSSSVQLTIRTPNNTLGVSENDTVFGSGKPADAVTIQGFGQSAYWDPDKATLNILGSNNWYIVSRSSNTQSDSVSVANTLKSGF